MNEREAESANDEDIQSLKFESRGRKQIMQRKRPIPIL